MPFFPTLNEPKTFHDVAHSVSLAKAILADLNIKVGESSVLHKIFQDSIKTSVFWEESKDKLNFKMALNLLYADVITSAIINLQDDPALRIPLDRIARSDITRGGRSPSRGKDALWELVLLDSMRKASIVAKLIDPPDIVADMSFGRYSIACKKVYSDANVEKQLRIGIRQVIESGNKGIVAFNLDNLTPEDSILSKSDGEGSLRRLAAFNDEFVERHRWAFQDAVKAKKIDGILVSTSVPADIKTDVRRLNNLSQYTFWTLTGKGKGIDRINSFVSSLSARPPLPA